MTKTFQQFIAENSHFADLQGVREASDQHAYFRNALEKAWQAGYETGVAANTGVNGLSAIGRTTGPDRHADAAEATREGIDKRLGATGEALE